MSTESSIDSKLPLVSVIIPAYNAEEFIGRTLDSVINQTYRNLEVLVVDDGSHDQTPEIVKQYSQQDPRITLYQQANQGVAAARNLAIANSKGEFIAAIDADDIWYRENLEKQVQELLQSDASVGLCYAWSAYINETDSLTGGYKISSSEGDVFADLLFGNFVGNASATVIRKTCFDRVGGYDPSLKAQQAQGCEDWDLYLRIAEQYKFRVVQEFLVGYRQTASSMSRNFRAMEKSYLLVMRGVQKTHSEISASVFHIAASNFYQYLSIIANSSGLHGEALFWIFKFFNRDPFNLLNFRLYKLAVSSLIKLIAFPITSRIWKNPKSWIDFKRKITQNHQNISLSELYKKIEGNQQAPKTLYNRIRLRRWSNLTRMFQPIAISTNL